MMIPHTTRQYSNTFISLFLFFLIVLSPYIVSSSSCCKAAPYIQTCIRHHNAPSMIRLSKRLRTTSKNRLDQSIGGWYIRARRNSRKTKRKRKPASSSILIFNFFNISVKNGVVFAASFTACIPHRSKRAYMLAFVIASRESKTA